MNRVTQILIAIVVLTAAGWVVFMHPRFTRQVPLVDTSAQYHESMYYYDNTDFYPQSVKAFADTKPLDPRPRIFITNQHVLAAHLIAQQFALAADPKVKTVILITQNNWTVGNAPIITSAYSWKTPLGTIAPATREIERLVSKNLASIDESIFKNEHGITGIIPYIAEYFPNAAVVPLVIKDKTDDALVDDLARELAGLGLTDTAIVGTIDMSHYLPQVVADAHDRLTAQAIQTFDYDVLPRLDIDTAPTLRTIMKVAEAKNLGSFVQTGHVNSAEIIGNPDLMETTSYLTGYFQRGGPAKDNNTAHLLFVGDLMFDRGIALHAEKYGIDTLFRGLERLFLGNDAVIGNLEGTITTEQSVALKDLSTLHFTFDPKFADLLKQMNFTAVSLANNHAGDFFEKGFVQTQQFLDRDSIAHFGTPWNDRDMTARITIGDRTVCVIGYHDLYTQNDSAAVKEIQKIRRECSYVVVFPHWGVEYETGITTRQRKLAHEFVDAGADLIIGAHPHVVEPVEVYHNKAIFYSLGNFIFDQGISFDTEHGLAVIVELSDDKTVFTPMPTELNHGEASVASGTARQRILGRLGSDILRDNKLILWTNKQ